IVGAELSFVTMTSTLRLTNSAAISLMRSGRPSDQRYSIARVRPSIQPRSCSRATKAVVQGPQADAFEPTNPIADSLPACCARRPAQPPPDGLAGPIIVAVRHGLASDRADGVTSCNGGMTPRHPRSGYAARQATHHTAPNQRSLANPAKRPGPPNVRFPHNPA